MIRKRKNMNDAEMKLWLEENALKRGDCWVWPYNISESGYGNVRYKYKMWRVHRLMYFLTNGEIYTNQLICHKCDNKKCFNPEHLYQGTNSSNTLDSMDYHKGVKLTKQQLLIILSDFDNIDFTKCTKESFYRKYTLLYGVSRSTIKNVCRGANLIRLNYQTPS